MNIRTIFKRCGIISGSEVRKVVLSAQARSGKLPPSHTHWDKNQLDKDARKLLRTCNISNASNRLVESIAGFPDKYIQDWEHFYGNVETCSQMVCKQIGKLPEERMSLRFDLLRSEVIALLDTNSVDEAINQLVTKVQKHPAIYIDGFSEMLVEKHLPLLETICKRDIGDDWDLNRELVKSRLMELFEAEESSEKSITKILLDISAAEKAYLIPTKSKAKELAQSVVAQLKPALLKALPPTANLNEGVLMDLVERLLIGGTPMKNLVKVLMNEIKKSPFLYISIPALEHSSVDHAMLAQIR